MADDPAVTAVAQALKTIPNGDGFPVNVRDDSEQIATVAVGVMKEQPRYAKEIRGKRNG